MKPDTQFLTSYRSHMVNITESDTELQYTFKFDNQYGASLLWLTYNIDIKVDYTSNVGSYGHENGLWELAVIKWKSATEYEISYSTNVAPDDVLGYLDERAVLRALKKIKKLTN